MTDIKVSITCPSCKKSFQQELLKIKSGMARKCPHCKAEIKYVGDDPNKIIPQAVGKIQDDLVKKIKKLFPNVLI